MKKQKYNIAMATIKLFPQQPLVVQLTHQSNTTSDPVGFGFVRWDHHGNNKVCGVTSSGQCPSSLAGLVHWTLVHRLVWNVGPLEGLQPKLKS